MMDFKFLFVTLKSFSLNKNKASWREKQFHLWLKPGMGWLVLSLLAM